MTADVNPWTLDLALAGPLVGTHLDLLGGYEAGFLLIADSEHMADCGPSLIPAEYELRVYGDVAPHKAGQNG